MVFGIPDFDPMAAGWFDCLPMSAVLFGTGRDGFRVLGIVEL